MKGSLAKANGSFSFKLHANDRVPPEQLLACTASTCVRLKSSLLLKADALS